MFQAGQGFNPFPPYSQSRTERVFCCMFQLHVSRRATNSFPYRDRPRRKALRLMNPFGEITLVGEVTDGPIPRTGPTRTRTIKVEVGGGGVAGFHELEISEPAGLELFNKLKVKLQERGQL